MKIEIYNDLRVLKQAIQPLPLQTENIFLKNRTLNPKYTLETFEEVARPRLFERVFRLPVYFHNSFAEVLNERIK